MSTIEDCVDIIELLAEQLERNEESMTFITAKPKWNGGRASVSVLSRGRTSVQLNITFDQYIADQIGVTFDDRVKCIIGEGSNAGFFGIVASQHGGTKVRKCGNKYIARSACTGNRIIPHSAKSFDIASIDFENKMVILRPSCGRLEQSKR